MSISVDYRAKYRKLSDLILKRKIINVRLEGNDQWLLSKKNELEEDIMTLY